MTLLIEDYKDEKTKTEYYGHVINDVEYISYNHIGKCLSIYTSEHIITLGLEIIKRLEVRER